MFRYFPTNYVWNLSVDLAIEMGARIGEIEEMWRCARRSISAGDKLQRAAIYYIAAERIRPEAPFKFDRSHQLVGLTAGLAEGLI
jgi:hypothetical protein